MTTIRKKSLSYKEMLNALTNIEEIHGRDAEYDVQPVKIIIILEPLKNLTKLNKAKKTRSKKQCLK